MSINKIKDYVVKEIPQLYTNFLKDKKPFNYAYVENLINQDPLFVADLIFKLYFERVIGNQYKQLIMGLGEIGYEKQITQLPFVSIIRSGIKQGVWYDARLGIPQWKMELSKIQYRNNFEDSSWKEITTFIKPIPKTISYTVKYWSDQQKDIDNLILHLSSRYGHGWWGLDFIWHPFIRMYSDLNENWVNLPLYIKLTSGGDKEFGTTFGYNDGERWQLIMDLTFEMDYFFLELQDYNVYEIIYSLMIDGQEEDNKSFEISRWDKNEELPPRGEIDIPE